MLCWVQLSENHYLDACGDGVVVVFLLTPKPKRPDKFCFSSRPGRFCFSSPAVCMDGRQGYHSYKKLLLTARTEGGGGKAPPLPFGFQTREIALNLIQHVYMRRLIGKA